MFDNATTDGKRAYYLRRAEQERTLALRTMDRTARRVHAELASRYAVLASETMDLPTAPRPA